MCYRLQEVIKSLFHKRKTQTYKREMVLKCYTKERTKIYY